VQEEELQRGEPLLRDSNPFLGSSSVQSHAILRPTASLLVRQLQSQLQHSTTTMAPSDLRVAFLGPLGTYSHQVRLVCTVSQLLELIIGLQATNNFFGDCSLVPCERIVGAQQST
jgi:hypothetical protein